MLGRASGIKKPSFDGFLKMAVGQGFEPREPLGSTVFKTAAFDHSASPPKPYRVTPENRAHYIVAHASIKTSIKNLLREGPWDHCWRAARLSQPPLPAAPQVAKTTVPVRL